MIINRIYEHENLLSLKLVSFLVGLRNYQHPYTFISTLTEVLISPQPDLLPHGFFFDGENISFDASLVIYINSTNIPSIRIINRIYETLNLLSLQLVCFLVGLRTFQHPCISINKNTTMSALLEEKCGSILIPKFSCSALARSEVQGYQIFLLFFSLTYFLLVF